MGSFKGWLIMTVHRGAVLGKEQPFIQGPYVVVMAYFKASAVCQLSIVYWEADKDPLMDENRCVGASWINCHWQQVCLGYFVDMGVTNDDHWGQSECQEVLVVWWERDSEWIVGQESFQQLPLATPTCWHVAFNATGMHVKCYLATRLTAAVHFLKL